MAEEYSYQRAKHEIPELAAMEDYAKAQAEEFSPARSEELRYMIDDESLPEEVRADARKELIRTSMNLVPEFLTAFPYRTNSAQAMADLMQDGFAILAGCVDKWDPSRGSFQGMCVFHLRQLYRVYYKGMTYQPQTGVQQDAKIREYDAARYAETGETPDAAETAKAVGVSEKIVKRARERAETGFGKVDSLNRLQELLGDVEHMSPGLVADGGHGRRIMADDFVRSAREALKGRRNELLLFDILTRGDAEELDNQDIAALIKQETGFDFTYQQIYRTRRRIAAVLVYKGVLDPSVADKPGWLKEEVAKLYRADLRKEKKYKYIWS